MRRRRHACRHLPRQTEKIRVRTVLQEVEQLRRELGTRR